MDQKSEKIFAGDFKPGFRIDLHIKDLQNAMNSSHEYNVSTPFTAQVMEMMQVMKAHDFGTEDHSAIARYFELVNNQKLQ